MIVVDTSIWIDHVRGKETHLSNLLGQGKITIHPFVLGELLLNGLSKFSDLASDIDDLPEAPVASSAEVAAFIAWAKLAGKGIGYVDTHLLLSAKLLPHGKILTQDKSLHAQAEKLGLAYIP